MRRKDREITDTGEIIDIVNRCKVCRLGLADGGKPYIVPLNYGYRFENGILTLFFHGAREGRKIDMMKKNRNACFEIDCDTELTEGEKPCDYGYAYRSVIGFGEITVLEDRAEKNAGLNEIMKHQSGTMTEYDFSGKELENVMVCKLELNEFTGKQRTVPERGRPGKPAD